MSAPEFYIFCYRETNGEIFPISFRIPGDDEASPFIQKDKIFFNIIEETDIKRFSIDNNIIIPILFDENSNKNNELYFLVNLIKINSIHQKQNLYLPKYDLLVTSKNAIQKNEFNSIKINSFNYSPTIQKISLNQSFINEQKKYLLKIFDIGGNDYNMVRPITEQNLENYIPNNRGFKHLTITRKTFTMRIYNQNKSPQPGSPNPPVIVKFEPKIDTKYSVMFYHIDKSGDIYIYIIGGFYNFLFDQNYNGTFSFGQSIKNRIAESSFKIETDFPNKKIINVVYPINLDLIKDAPELFMIMANNYKKKYNPIGLDDQRIFRDNPKEIANFHQKISLELDKEISFSLFKLSGESSFKIDEKIFANGHPFLTGKKCKIEINDSIDHTGMRVLNINLNNCSQIYISFSKTEFDVITWFYKNRSELTSKPINIQKLVKTVIQDDQNVNYDVIEFN